MLKKVKKIALIGAKGTALNILYQVQDAILNYGQSFSVAGIIIDDIPEGNSVGPFKVIGSTDSISSLVEKTDLSFLYCLYKMDRMSERWELLQKFNIPADRMPNFIHPLSYTSSDLNIGYGNVILSNSSVQSEVTIGNNNIINTGVSVEHNTNLGNGNFIAANSCIGSHVSIGSHCFIGLNSSIREDVVLGDNVFVGMHSLVLQNFKDCRIAGSPAKII